MEIKIIKKFSYLFFKYTVLILPAVWIYALSLRPIVSIDALKLHMAFPSVWKDEGFLFFRRFNAKIELGMMNVDYLYMLLLKFFSWEQLPKILHASFLVFTGILAYMFIKKRFSEKYALFAYLLIMTLPIDQRLASEVYVDLGILFFSTVSIIYFTISFEDCFKRNYFFLSAVFSGLAAGSKYNGYIFAFIMCLTAVFNLSKFFNTLRVIKYTVLYSLIVIILISPWLYRNYSGSGNPFYPIFSGIFETNIEQPENLPISQSEGSEMALRFVSGESFFDVILIPVRFFFTGRDNDFLFFDGVLNPFLLLLLPLSLIGIRKKSDFLNDKLKISYAMIFIFVLIVSAYYSSARIRYALPMIFPLVVLITAGLKDFSMYFNSSKYRNLLLILITLPPIIYNLNYAVSFSKDTGIIKYLNGETGKTEYLRSQIPFFDIYEYINDNTPEDAVIYDVLCGNRMYYVDREYICSDSNLNWWFYNIVYREEGTARFYKFLSDLPNSDNKKADYLLIKPNGFYSTYLDIFYDKDDPENAINKRKLKTFIDFIRSQTPLMISEGTVLYKINY